MSRIIASLLQALVALAVTSVAQCRPEPLSAHLAGSGALPCARGHGAAVGVVGAHTGRRGGSARAGFGTSRIEPARGEPAGVRVPGRGFVAAELTDVQTWRPGGSERRTLSRPGSIRPAATRSTVAEAGWRGLRTRASDLPPGWPAITLTTGVRARSGGARLAPTADVTAAPRPPTSRNANVNPGGLSPTGGLRRPCQSGDIHPHWWGRPAGSASNAPVFGDRLGTSRGHPGDIVRSVPFLRKWAVALLPIAKGLNP